MSDDTIKEAIAGAVILGSLALNLLLNRKVSGVEKAVTTVGKDITTAVAAVATVDEKVTVVHEQVNSKMDKQLKMTRALAKAEQKVEDAINGKHKIVPDKKVPVKRKK